MQKKILLSLLVASPAALPAVANIDYGHGSWESDGLSGSDNVNIDLENGNVSCVLGSGPTKWIVKELLPGKYQLAFATVENLSVEVTQNGKTLVQANGSTSVDFEIKTQGEVTITAKGITANAYSFTGANLQLIFDFEAVGNALQTQLDNIDKYVTIADEKYPGAAELLSSKKTLESTAAGYQTSINQIKDPATSTADLEKLYKDQKLYESPSLISSNITALGNDVKEWNEQANALNKKIQNTADNTATKNTLLNEQKNLLTNIDALINKIKGGSEYGQNTDLQSAETLKSKIENYSNEINSAYADDKLAGEISFESKKDALQKEIDDLQTKWEADEADWNAYSTFMNTVFPALQNSYDDASKKINALSGLKGFENIFDSQKNEALTDVKNTFDTAKTELNINNVAGAAAILEGDQQTVTDAQAAIQEIVDNITKLVNSQNTNKQTADSQIDAFNKSLNHNKFTVAPDTLKEDYDAAVADIEAKIADLNTFVDENYGKASLEVTAGSKVGDDYLAKVAAIQEALNSFKDLVAPIAEINKLAKDFEDVKTYIKTESDKLGTDFINIYGLFDQPDGTFASIDNAIKNLTTIEEVEAQKDAIQESINDAKATADKLIVVFTQLQKANTQYEADVTDLRAFVAAKIEIDNKGADATVLKDKFLASAGNGGKFIASQQNFTNDLKNLASGDMKPQAIYDKAVALRDANVSESGDELTYLWQPNLDQIKKDFAQEVTESNNTNLNKIIQAAKDFVADGEYTGKDSIDFNEIDTKASAIATAITAAASAENPVEAYGDADEDIVKLIPDVNALKTLAEKYKQNQADYDALLAKLGTPGLQEGINKLILQNANESKDGGKDYFDNVINGSGNTNSLQAQLNAIRAALDEALANYADLDKNVTGQKVDLEAKINALTNLIKKTADDITNNNTAHTQQLNTAEQVSEYIAAALDTLEEYYKDQEGIEDWYNDTKEKITTLRDEDLFNNNVAVANAYGEGKSFTDNDKLTGEYERILNEVENLVNSMMDEYTQAVIAANTAVVVNAQWDASKKAMNDEYVAAIQMFNNYWYGLTNEGWKNAVMEVVERHTDIYDFSQKINNLIAEVNDYIKDNNEAPVTFTAEEFKENATDKANALIDEMKQKVDELNSQIAELAVEYYNTNHSAAEEQINGYQTKLDNAGITGNYLDNVKSALKDAETKYANANEATATEPLGLAMDRIADDLDNAKKTIDLQPVAQNAWNAAYGDAKAKADKILSDLKDSNNNDYKFADSDLRTEAAEKVAEKISEMAELNTEVSGVKKDLIDAYKGYKDQLDALMDAINDLDQSVKENSSNNKANEDLYNTLIGTTIPDLEKAYKELVEYSATLAGGQKFDSDAIKSQIDALKSYVESHTGSLAANRDKITSDCNAIQTAITNGYPQIGANEYSYLNYDLLNKVKVAFNDAKAAFLGAEGTTSNLDKATGEEQLNEWNDQIDRISKAVADLNEMLNPTKAFDKAGFQKEAIDLENQLADLYVALEQTWSSNKHEDANPIDAILAQLEKEYNDVKDAIAAAKDYLDGCEEGLDTTGFETALNAASDALDAEKTDWESIGNRVISMQPTYSEAMQDIAENVADILTAAKDANEKAIAEAAAKAANDAAYSSLSANLDDLRNELNRVAELAESWYGDEYKATINNISKQIDQAENDLKTKYENVQLTADSKLLNGTVISNDIASLELNVTSRRARDTRGEAQTALRNAGNALLGHLIPEEKKALQEQINELQSDFTANYEKETDTEIISVKVLNEVIAEYERIAEEAAQLETTAKENSYVPGDVDLNPDGIVTAIDVQTIINWILEGKTWQELLAENPRQAYAADLNGDQELNITDVTIDIALVFGETPEGMRAARLAKAPSARIESRNALGLEFVGEENGIRRYAVMLSNTDQLIGGQLDIKLPAGMNVRNVATAERTANHTVESREVDFGTLRVVLYSMDNAVIEGESGAVIYVDVEGDGELKGENAVFTDSLFNTLNMNNSNGTSFIDSIVDGAKEMTTRFYNAAGVMFNKLQNGINIFRDKDGKVKKEYHRN